MTVTAIGGTGTLANGFRYVAAPTIGALSPSKGPVGGGPTITLTGTNFLGVTGVTIGGQAATNVSVTSEAELTLTLPPVPASGPKTVVITAAGGTASKANGFTYVDPPTIIGDISPPQGPVTGGTLVTITGTNLSHNPSITIGGQSATNLVIVSDSMLRANAPSGAVGAQTVVVTTIGGSATRVAGFTYIPAPIIGGVSPSQGPLGGNTEITITGSNLTGASSVTIGGLPANGITPVNSTTLKARTPQVQTAGPRNVAVTTVGGTATAINAFEYLGAPTVTGVSPQLGPMVGNTLITITGTGFAEVSSVKIGNTSIQPFTVQSSTVITCYTPSSQTAGPKNVSVTTVGGTFELANGFTYLDVPTIASVSPPSGATTGGEPITVSGNNFTGATSVRIGDFEATEVVATTNTTITARTPPGAVGPKAVTVTTPGGVDVKSSAFSYYEPASIASISPTSGSTAGSTTLTITGANLSGTNGVKVGGVDATNVIVVSATKVLATTPPGSLGAKTVSLTSSNGPAQCANCFTYENSVWFSVLQQAPDPSAVPNETTRNEIVATGLPWRVRDNLTQIEMVLIPPGTFNMGCSASNLSSCSNDELPIHSVTLTEPFYIGRYEVTQAQWTAAMGANPSWHQGTSYPDAASRPVEQVTWDFHIQPFLSATGMRLPTEAEWEFAYRAKTTTPFHSMPGFPNGTIDDAQVGAIAWYSASGSPGGTRAVGRKASNGFGLFDMSGNVYELVSDRYSSTYYQSSPTQNPTGPATGNQRVMRGGSVASGSGDLRSSERGALYSDAYFRNYGFRVARTYRAGSAPALFGVTPAGGPLTGGTLVTIKGANLTGATAVTIGGVSATNVTVVNSNTITAVTQGGGTTGPKDVVVNTPLGPVTASGAYTFVISPTWATVLESAPNPSVVTDPTLRAAIVGTGFPWRIRDNTTQIEMVLIPNSAFAMGCSPSSSASSTCSADESPVHSVTLNKPFYIGRSEVTQAQWTAVMGSNPSYFQGAGYPDAPNRPVEQVTWSMVQEFLAASGLKLPTEAEWECAYRAGTSTAYHPLNGSPTGVNDESRVGELAWFAGNNGASGTSTYGTKPVGQKAQNSFGLYDMSGNVAEWVHDWYASNYYSSSPSNNPIGPSTGTLKILRGGTWLSSAPALRSSCRIGVLGPNDLSTIGFLVGFRAARYASDAAIPTITSVSPSTGPTYGGTSITITGADLSNVFRVRVGGVDVTNLTVVNSTTITAIVSPGTAGAKTVTVYSPDGAAKLAGGFTYVTAPWYTVLEQVPDPSIVTSAALRNAIIATGLPWRVRDNNSQIEMLLIPPGTFSMGCSASNLSGCSSTENPVHTVTLTSAFYLGRYEVTQAQWAGRIGSNPSGFQSASPQVPAAQVPNRPVENVSIDGVQPFLSSTGLRLPTEAEWEYAYRAGTTTAFHSMPGFSAGTNDDSQVAAIAWYFSNSSSQTRPVGQRAANGYGLHDMSGNVSEFVNDWLSDYPATPQTNPTGPASGVFRLSRGGHLGSSSSGVRSSGRAAASGDYAYWDTGFRVARNP